MISILVCSYKESKYLSACLKSLAETIDIFPYEILVDIEDERTGLANTPRRYQALWERSRGDIIVKSDDDIHYFNGWLSSCVSVLRASPDIGYVGPLNHILMKKSGINNMQPKYPIITGGGPYEIQPFLAGGCWVFRRDLWKDIPYGDLAGIKTLDSNYGASVRKAGKLPAYLSSVLCSHMGTDRHGGIDVK